MNKLTELIEVAKAATPIETDLYGDRYFRGPYSQALLTKEQDRFFTLANPTTILELCALLEKVEEALRFYASPDSEADWEQDHGSVANKALAAIKQWKEQT